MVQTRSPLPAYDCCASVDAILLQIDPLIVALTERIQCATLTDWEREEIAQRVRMKLWEALPGKEISNPRAYLRRTVHHEFISFLRQRKVLSRWATNEDGEPYQGKTLITLSQGMGDPQGEVEQEEALQEMMERVVDAIMALPKMQKVAMVCYIRERLDDPNLLTEAFKRRDLDITVFQWPQDRVAKQRLQASCRPGRLSMAQQMKIDLCAYLGRRSDGEQVLQTAGQRSDQTYVPESVPVC
jgi:DNA-directed RNA polymerase specialized sigma24 family protein